MGRPCRCSCGAAGDETELVEHVVTAMEGGEGAHRWLTGAEPDQVATARAARDRRAEVRQRLASAAGVTVDELREVLG